MTKRLLPILLVALTCALAQAQTATPLVQPFWTFVDGSGAPCSGCSLYSYLAGTTTPTPTYTDASKTTVNTNPIILNVAGGAQIWVGTPSLKLVLKDTLGATIWTADQIAGGGGGGGSSVCGPASTVQFANSTVTGLDCDSLITINKLSHTLNVGGALPATHFTLANLSTIPSSWTLDVTSKTTAFNSIQPLTTKGDILCFASTAQRLAVGTDTWALVADSTQACGMKWAAIAGGITQLTGDVTTPSGSGSQAATLATVNSSPGACGDATHICSITTNGKGLVTAQSQIATGGGVRQRAQVSGCSFPNDGGGLSCTGLTITWPTAFADTSYTIGCWPMYSFSIAGGSSTQPVIDLNATPNTTTTATVTEGVAQGSSGGWGVSSSYGLTIICEGFHN